MVGVILRCELGTVLFTGDYKFDQTPVGGAPADVSRLAELGRDGRAAAVRRLDERGPARDVGVRERGRAEPRARVRALPGPDRDHVASPRTSTACSRSSTPPCRSGARSAWSGRSMRKNVNIGRTLGHIVVPEGTLIPPRELDNWPDDRVVIISTGSQGEPLSRAAPHGLPRPSADRAARGRHRRVLRHADPRQRARGQRDDRPALPDRLRGHHPARRGDPRVRARLSGGAEADAQPDPAAST